MEMVEWEELSAIADGYNIHMKDVYAATMKRIGLLGIGSNPTPSLPDGLSDFTQTMRSLHGVVAGEAVFGLAHRIWRIAADELKRVNERAQNDLDGLENIRFHDLQKLEEDRTSRKFLYSALLTIDDGFAGLINPDDKVFESLILNTTGHCFKNSLRFKSRLKTSSDGPGAYITTLTSRTEGVYQRNEISGNDWRLLRDKVYSYLRWCYHSVPEDDDDPNYEEFLRDAEIAAHIEWRHHRRDEDFDHIHEDTVKGRRSLATDDCRRILEVLNRYVDFYSGPNNDLHMKQSLIFVGSSYNMRSVVDQPGEAHFPSFTSKPFSLVLGCLLCMDTDIVTLNIPVLRVWKEDQLLLAQEALRWLTGAHGEVRSIDREEIGILDGLRPDDPIRQGFARVEKERQKRGIIWRNRRFDHDSHQTWCKFFSLVIADEDGRRDYMAHVQRIIDESRRKLKELEEKIATNKFDIAGRRADVHVPMGHLSDVERQRLLDAIEKDDHINGGLRSHHMIRECELAKAEGKLEYLNCIQESLPDLLEYLEKEWPF